MNNKIKTGLSNKEVFQNRLKYGNNALSVHIILLLSYIKYVPLDSIFSFGLIAAYIYTPK